MAQVAVLIVSHSKSLAEGAKELALQMARAQNSVWAVGGTDDARIGTSAPAIHAALEKALAAASSVVVLMDLGSAYLNTVMALEMLSPEAQKRVFLADAPLVEGAILAVVAATSGDGPADVRARAEEARDMRKVM